MSWCWKTFLAILSLVFLSDVVRAEDDNRYRREEIGPCVTCKAFAESFEKGIQHTRQEPHSPLHLAHIKQGLCDEPRTKTKCLETAEQAWPLVEEWWQQEPAPEFFHHICIEKLEVCCPKHHFGRHCSPCPGQGEVCSGHGKCRGDGTRKGNGTCLCDTGYGGKLCTDCLTGFYMTEEGSCKRCHSSCAGGCREGTPRDCVACRTGYLFDADVGCHDYNECDDINICQRNEFCVNTMGSFRCVACNRACKGCYGDSPDMCRKCAKGYRKMGEMCVAEREDVELEMMTSTRYLTYLGLLVAGGVLYPRAPALAGGVFGLTVSYIALAEFYCRNTGHTSLLDLPHLSVRGSHK